MDLFSQLLDALYATSILERVGFFFGFLAVWYLIKESVWTWPAGIIYCLVSFYVLWQAKLYLDFILTIFFLVMNIYGWWFWYKPKANAEELPITNIQPKAFIIIMFVSFISIFIAGHVFKTYTDASLPYWDATTTILSLSAMFMTAKKQIENWILWFVVDIVATGLYFYKELYLYAALYFIYLIMAVAGYYNWKKLQHNFNH